MPAPAFQVARDLDASLRAAAASLGWPEAEFSPEVRLADPRHGDFQANGVLGFAKRRRQPPPALARELAAAWSSGGSAGDWDLAVAGPGFLNFTLRPTAAWNWLAHHRDAATLAAAARGAPGSDAGRTIVVDYSSPNTAKQMHVGHLRSAVIGEALCRLLEFNGARVVRDNHIGDWGTQFGKLIWAWRRARDEEAVRSRPIEEFERLYNLGNAAAADPAVLEEARAELVRLQQGDPEALAIWRTINTASLEAFDAVYARLGLRFDHVLGESFYNDKVAAVYEELTRLGLATESEGALVVFHPEHPRFATQPFLVRKADGAANYASSDLATMQYRVEHFGADGIIILTDVRQTDHFEQLWLTTRKWFAATGRRLPTFDHVTFGAVLGENGKPLKTRDGGTIKLRDLLDEAVERAHALVTARGGDLAAEETRAIAEVVGVGSVQYADLCQNRTSDYVFAWDKMISLEGNTAAYLLYAVARLHSLFRTAGLAPGEGEEGAGPPETNGEIALARHLVRFPEALGLARSQLRPHFLAQYLYELSGTFSSFYTDNRVLVPGEPATQARRLSLCARTLLVLETGLRLLGLRTLARM